MTDPTDKQIAEAAEAAYPQDFMTTGGALQNRRAFERGARWALAARPVPEDVAALVAELRNIECYHGGELRDWMRATIGEAAAALEVSSRTVAPNREALANVVSNAMIRAKTDTPEGVADALLAADLWQPAPVIDREAFARALWPNGFEDRLWAEPSEQEAYQRRLFEQVDRALLASGWQPASPRTVTPEDIAAEYMPWDGNDPAVISHMRGIIAAAIRYDRSLPSEGTES